MAFDHPEVFTDHNRRGLHDPNVVKAPDPHKDVPPIARLALFLQTREAPRQDLPPKPGRVQLRAGLECR